MCGWRCRRLAECSGIDARHVGWQHEGIFHEKKVVMSKDMEETGRYEE
jgi:hypothetical protein